MKLKIPANAERSNATGRKCRAEFAEDIGHFTSDGEPTQSVFTSLYDPNFKYTVGKIVKPPTWDKDRWNECSGGIHFFITREEAENFSM